ncbi:DUF6371 domain-containing protein, partial [Parabacteroides merdae]|uniref:DUF6371 domain-containing protein n=2 Tax=Parabacteroides merdae TaxID=46503 RepID=UPI00232B3473
AQQIQECGGILSVLLQEKKEESFKDKSDYTLSSSYAMYFVGTVHEEWLLSQCLFGEHLLSLYPDKVVVLVESEKSAIIGSAIFPNYVWLATGGKSQMKEDKLRVLSGRTVLLFPDADGYSEWKQRAESMTYCKAIVSDLLEKHATPKQKADHIDIADWIIFQIQEGKLISTANHLVEAEKILQQMIEKNPVLQKLIDELDLVLVDASHIASDDKSPP